MENLGQWKHTRAENPEWNRRALSWPINEDGEINENYDWPMEGFFMPYAPPLTRSGDKKPTARKCHILIMHTGKYILTSFRNISVVIIRIIYQFRYRGSTQIDGPEEWSSGS